MSASPYAPSRRQFLGSLAAAPFFVHAARKSGNEEAIVGSGDHRYRCDHHWGQIPDSIRWFETHGVAIDKAGHVYVTHRAGPDRPASPDAAQDTVVVFDPNGRFIRSFGKAWHGGGHGIDIRDEGGQEFLYLAFMFPINLVVKTDLQGEIVWIKDRTAIPTVYDDPKVNFSPTNVAFAPDGGFYAADGYGSNYIHQFDRDGQFVRTWGGTGDGPNQYRTPHGIGLDDRPGRTPSLVIADRANARLQYTTLDGQFIAEDHNVSFPAHFDTRGEILLVPDLHARVTLMNRNNDVIAHLGHDADWTREVLDGFKVRLDPGRWPAGKFVHPHDACFDHDGNILVAEWVVPGRLSKLTRLG
ncbi:MAG: hypothetical protein KatS3mg108_0178 [Isosphaeraceae bacterium]|jgi:hypothetical protein|nr:MAG: hypothetical protein KatS3mg108_0178 [Isosphaeraceae bacterium]